MHSPETNTRSTPNYALRLTLAFAFAFALFVAAAPFSCAQTESVLFSFTGGPSGNFPLASLLLRSGNLYGTTVGGNGDRGSGTVFEITRTGKEKLLYIFSGGADGGYPVAGVIADSAGNLFGTTSYGGTGYGTVFKLTPEGKETVLYNFMGTTDGGYPQGSLVQDSKGNLYGMTPYGGASWCASCGFGYGAVFKVTLGGAESLVYSFTGGADGAYPYAGLIWGGGNLYGVTSAGGTFNLGTVFEVTLGGNETVLHSFAGGASDGALPEGNLVRDANGNLYGTTRWGGTSVGSPDCTSGCGTVYKLTAAGAETVAYNFTDGSDGRFPSTGLVRDAAGNLYGTTPHGGSNLTCFLGCGTVFEVTTTGAEKILYSFGGKADGATPYAALVRDGSGNLYGTASAGGNTDCQGGCGVLFRVASTVR